MKKIFSWIKKNPARAFGGPFLLLAILWVVLLPASLIALSGSGQAYRNGGSLFWSLAELLARGIMGGLTLAAIAEIIGYPLALTCLNLYYLMKRGEKRERSSMEGISEGLTVGLGVLLSWIYISGFTEIIWKDWDVALYNKQVHAPIATWTLPTVITLAAIGILGYLILHLVPLRRQPPLLTVLSISAVYMGGGVCILWILQTVHSDGSPYYMGDFLGVLLMQLFPWNCLLLGAKEIRRVIGQWQELHPKGGEAGSSADDSLKTKGLSGVLRALLYDSKNWPWLAFLFLLPLLGLMIALLTLIGQKPDSIIEAWTQTSQWTLSQQISPPNIYYDEHYLCTAAAGGHRRVVKPLRFGVRHGHRVIVNRQLCIANAFEQILEERLPGLHRRVRYFYDTCGYPIARHIRSPLAADITYIMMKPLEWIFLTVIYLCDTKPENRIAMQYITPMGDAETDMGQKEK